MGFWIVNLYSDICGDSLQYCTNYKSTYLSNDYPVFAEVPDNFNSKYKIYLNDKLLDSIYDVKINIDDIITILPPVGGG